MYRIVVILLCVLFVVPFQAFASEVKPPDVAVAAPARVLFSEILANPLDESTGEFVELYNAGDEPVDLNGWFLSDLVDVKDTLKDYSSSFDIGLPGTLLASHSFAVIVDPDYAGQYNDLITARADLASLIMITVDDTTLGNGLGNTSDTLNLKSSDELYFISHAWASDTGNGFSWAGFGLGSETETWKKSAQVEGMSPGFVNNVAPQAALTKTHEEGIVPLNLTFDASESLDPEALPLNFSLDFGDGEAAGPQTTPAFAHTYDEVSNYTATLTVQDSEGATHAAQATVLVNQKAVIVPCTLAVTEVLPNPSGDDTTDEYIEIQNRGSAPCNLLGYSLDDIEGGSTPFTFPDTSLAAGAYLATYASMTHITLNNTGDSVRILNSTAEVVSSVTYTDSREAQSYALSGPSFSWTTTLTPNAANVITDEPDEEDPEEPTPPGEPEPDDPLPLSTIREAKKLEKGDDVMVEGFVIAKVGTLSSQYLYIHDGTAGIQIYSSKKLFPTARLGQKVRVTGTISKTAGLTRILTKSKDDIEVLLTTKSVKAYSKKTGIIRPTDEGELVTVTGKIEKKLGTSALINDGSGALSISFRDGSGLKSSSVTTGEVVTVQGVVTVSNDQVSLLPRGTGDIIAAASLKLAANGALPKAGIDTKVVLLTTSALSALIFGCLQLFRSRSSKTLLSASTKNSGIILGATRPSIPDKSFTSSGETFPIKRS